MTNKEIPKAKPIKAEIRPILEKFLNDRKNMQMFRHFAKALGYDGDDETKIRELMFFPDSEGNIRFTIAGLYDLFLEFQLMEELGDKEPYKSLLERNPNKINDIRELVKRMIKGDLITNEDIMKIFEDGKTDNGEDSKQIPTRPVDPGQQ